MGNHSTLSESKCQIGMSTYFSGALVNAVFLVALCFSITMESLKRFYEPEDIHDPTLILIVGALGLVVNVLGK